MPATDTSIWDYAVSYGGPSLFMTAVFVAVLPLVYFKFARPRFRRWPPRLALLLLVWLIAFGIAYGDVLMIARETKRLCETEAGLRVYRTVEAEGFAGMSGIDEWARKGFSFVETIRPDGSSIIFRLIDGQSVSAATEKPMSDYGYSILRSPRTSNVRQRREIVSDLRSGDVLGELVVFVPSLGWLDRFFVKLGGASAAPRICEGKGLLSPYQKTLSFRTLIDSTIRPPNT